MFSLSFTGGNHVTGFQMKSQNRANLKNPNSEKAALHFGSAKEIKTRGSNVLREKE